MPTLAALSFPAGRFEREMHDLFGVIPVGHPLPRRLVRHAHWPAGWYPMRATPDRRRRSPPATAVPFRHRRGPGRLRDPGRAGARRADRTRPLPVLRRRRDHPQAQGPAVVRPPRRREALRGRHRDRRACSSPNGSAATPPSATRSPTALAVEDALGIVVPPDGAAAAGAAASNWSGSTTTSPTSARWPTTSVSRSPTPTPADPRATAADQRDRHRPSAAARRRSSPAGRVRALPDRGDCSRSLPTSPSSLS